MLFKIVNLTSSSSLYLNLIKFRQIWEFEEAHQRWLPVAELVLSEDEGDRVHAVAWAPNIGRLVLITSNTSLYIFTQSIAMLNHDFLFSATCIKV